MEDRGKVFRPFFGSFLPLFAHILPRFPVALSAGAIKASSPRRTADVKGESFGFLLRAPPHAESHSSIFPIFDAPPYLFFRPFFGSSLSLFALILPRFPVVLSGRTSPSPKKQMSVPLLFFRARSKEAAFSSAPSAGTKGKVCPFSPFPAFLFRPPLLFA